MASDRLQLTIVRSLMVWSHAHPCWTAGLVLCLSVLATPFVGRLSVETSPHIMTAADDPDQEVYRHVGETFGSESLAVVYVEDQALFSRATLETLEKLIYRLEQINGINRVESLFSIPSVAWENDAVYVGPLIAGLPGSDSETELLRKRASQSPLAAGRLLSRDGKATTINLYLEQPSDESNLWLGLARQIESTLQPFYSDFEMLFQAGRPMTIKTQADMIRTDQKRLIVSAVAVLCAALWVMTGTASAAVLPLLTGGLSIYWTLGFMGACGFPITVLTFIIPSLIIIIGSTEDIHLIAFFQQGIARTVTPRDAVSHMAEHAGTAVFFTSLTTTCGFLTIAVNDTQIMQQFGVTAAFAMAANFISTIVIAPPYLGHISRRCAHVRPSGPHLKRYYQIADRIHCVVVSRKGRILPLILTLLCLSLGYWVTRLEINTDLLKIFRDDAPIVKHAEILGERLSGTGAFYLYINTHQPGALRRPVDLQRLELLQDAVDDLGIADHTVSIADYLHLVHQAFNNGEDSQERLPSQRGAIAEYLLFIHPMDLRRMVNADFSEAVIGVRHRITSTHRLAEALDRIEKASAGIAPPAWTVKPVGEFILVQRALDRIVRSQMLAVVSLSVLLAILIGGYYRSVQAGLLAMLPNLFPVVLIYGIMGVLSVPLNLGTSLVIPVAVGIAVDDTIHFMIRFQSYRKQYREPGQAVKKTLQSELMPVASTSLALTLGFAMLALSQFGPIRSFGILAALAMLIALIGDLALTPMIACNAKCMQVETEAENR